MAAANASPDTMRATALYAPSSTKPIACGAPTDLATAVASTVYTRMPAGSAAGSTSGTFAITGPPGRRRASTGSLNRWCATIADHAEASTGSDRNGSSPTTTLAFEGPPRISPP
jgi:hypothetical protein